MRSGRVKPPGRSGGWLPLGTLWMVLRRWLTSTSSPNACVVPLSLQGSSPSTPRPVFGLVRDGEVGVDKKNNNK